MACSYIEPCTWVDNIHCDGRFNLFVIEERLVQALRASMGYRFTAVQVYRGRKKKKSHDSRPRDLECHVYVHALRIL